ncbi:MAG: aminotransferase class V-fold PLP-dependent enzyme [Pseudomonadota bacterium]
MTGPGGHRTYLDWNASAPLRPEARDAMLRAMDEVGNPSSVHGEGRKAKAIVERARAQVADLLGCEPSEVIFTSGATEAASLAIHSEYDVIYFSEAEHDCVYESALGVGHSVFAYPRAGGLHEEDEFAYRSDEFDLNEGLFAVAAANGETGVCEDYRKIARIAGEAGAEYLCDVVQLLGKAPFNFASSGIDCGIASGHKLGGPKGVGALINKSGREVFGGLQGGGQEQSRRAGTENTIGIAGFGAAAEAAKRDLESGVWTCVEELRNILETTLEDAASDLLIIGEGAPRLPNTSCFAIPGWKGETQVMQMDLAGFAVSAGSACSSGKVNKASRVLLAMGFDEDTASSAIRVSMGPTTTEAEVLAFAETWTSAYRRWRQKAA